MRQLETIVHTFCDVCMARDNAQREAVELDAIKLTVNGRPRRLDVCETHRNPTWNEITAYWTDDTDQPAKPKQGKVACPICHEPSGSNPRGVLMHLNRKHASVDLARRQELAGMPVTAKAAPAKRRRARKAAA